jgi:hypothetical protein
MTDRLTIDQINSAGLDRLYDERDRAETALARIAALADQHPAGIDTALILEALALAEQPRTAATHAADGGSFPAHHDGPTLRECAEADRRWWGSEKVGE